MKRWIMLAGLLVMGMAACAPWGMDSSTAQGAQITSTQVKTTPTPKPSPSPQTTATPTPSPTATPSPSPTPRPSATPTPTPRPTATPTASPSPVSGLSAVINRPQNLMQIAPFTTLFSGASSTTPSGEVVRWEWDFGDSASQDSATAEGMLVAHRFDNPGTYTVRLTIFNSAGQSAATATNVSVVAFSGATFYVSNSSGSDSNDGRTTGTPWKTLDYAFTHMGGGYGAPNRVLLKRGDQWTNLDHTFTNLPRPSMVGAYGTGEAPLLSYTSSGNGFEWGAGGGVTDTDPKYAIRLEDLHLKYPTPHGSPALVTPYLAGSVLRNLTLENGGIVATLQRFGIVVEDSTVTMATRQGMFSGGDDIVFRRNVMRGSGSNNILDHQVYFSMGSRWLVEDSLLDGSGGTNNFATKMDSGNTVVLRHNEAMHTRNGFGVGANGGQPRTENIIVEKNISHDNGAANQGAGFYSGGVGVFNMTIRNNIFFATHLSPTYAIAGLELAQQDTTSHVRIYNNVFYGNEVADIHVYNVNGIYNVDIQNNVFMRTHADAMIQISGNTGGIQADHNVYFQTGATASTPTFKIGDVDNANYSFSQWQALGFDAHSLFANPLLSNPIEFDFSLQTGSPAIDAGAALATVFEDYNGNPRPQGGGVDIGAFER